MTSDLQQKANILKKKILTMEWDLKQGQLHAAKVARVKKMKEELKELEQQIEEQKSSKKKAKEEN